MKKMKVKAFKPLKFRVVPYSILVEDLDSTIRWVCKGELEEVEGINMQKIEHLIDKLYEEITLVLTEDIDFES